MLHVKEQWRDCRSSWYRPPQDWDEVSFDWFMAIVYSRKVPRVGLDKVCWKLARSRGFEVRSFYLSFYPPTISFPWRLVWQSNVSPRVAFFSWLASLGKRCGESVDHLLLHCSIAFELWSLMFCLFGLHWVMPLKVLEVFESWQGKFGQHRNIIFWRLVSHCLMWCIWRERNARCFEGCERSLHALLVWSVALSHCSCFSLPALLDHWNFGS